MFKLAWTSVLREVPIQIFAHQAPLQLQGWFVLCNFKMFVSFKWGRTAAEQRGGYLRSTEKGMFAPFSLVYFGHYAAFIVFQVFCLLRRYALYLLLKFKRVISLQVILLVLYKYDCFHLIQLQLSHTSVCDSVLFWIPCGIFNVFLVLLFQQKHSGLSENRCGSWLRC